MIDFSKLKKGDSIVIEVFSELKKEILTYTCFFQRIGGDEDIIVSDNTHGYTPQDFYWGFLFSQITKITRINLQQKTFEEI